MAIRALNSVGGFSVGEIPANIILGNGDITGSNISANGTVSFSGGNVTLGNISNLHISGGSSGQAIITDGLGNLSFTAISSSSISNGSSNVSIPSINGNVIVVSGGNTTLTVTGTGANIAGTLSASGNANLGNLGTEIITATGNANVGNLGTTGLFAATLSLSGNANVGNIDYSSNINFTSGSNTTLVITGTGANIAGTLSASGNANLGNIGTDIITATGTITGANLSTSGTTTIGNITVSSGGLITGDLLPSSNNTGNLGNSTLAWKSLWVSGNTINLGTQAISSNNDGIDLGANTLFATTLSVSGNANIGNIGTAGGVFTNTLSASGNANVGNIGTEIITATGNANVGNLGTTGVFSTTLSATGNANIGNIGTEIITATGNANVGNLGATGVFSTTISATGNANLGNIGTEIITATGNANVGNLGTTGVFATTISASGNANLGNIGTEIITATGNANVGNLGTTGLFAATISASGNANVGNIGANIAVFTGTGSFGGNLDMNSFWINNVSNPLLNQDVATKQYVDDAVSTGLTIHEPVQLASPINISGTYANGGTTPTANAISGNSTITFSTSAGLAVNDLIYFATTTNGLTANIPYFVATTNGTNQITVSPTYNGIPILTLVNGSGLSIASRANPGVGATLTNSGANVALVIDGISVTNGQRILLFSQSGGGISNGVYVVTDAGAPDAPGPGSTWVLTRASDANTYSPNSTMSLSAGDYFFIQSGATLQATSYVMTLPTTAFIFGIADLVFVQFSASQAYSAGTGLTLTGTTFSVNNSQSQITAVGTLSALSVAGNANVGNLGTTGVFSTTLSASGNANVGNLGTDGVFATTLSATGNANIGNIGTGIITASGNVTAANFATSGSGGNISGANIISALTFTATGNISTVGNVYAGNLTVSAISNLGNVGNVIITGGSNGQYLYTDGLGNLNWSSVSTSSISNGSSNVSIPAANGNIDLVSNGNTTLVITGTGAFVTGTLSVTGNANVGNLGTTGVFATTLSATGNANVGNIGTEIITATGNANVGNLGTTGVFSTTISATGNANVGNIGTEIITATGNANVGNLGTTGVFSTTISATGNANIGNIGTGVITATGNVTGGNLITPNSGTVVVGNSAVGFGTVTTSSTSANQTIANIVWTGSNINGVEYIIKAVDASGSKYTMCTVQAVTDGTYVDWAQYGGQILGGTTGTLAVNLATVGFTTYLLLQATPSSSNSTVWVTQFRTI